MPTDAQWQHARLVITIIIGTATLIWGIRNNEPAAMTVGGGLIGFSPAAKGPAEAETPKLEVAH